MDHNEEIKRFEAALEADETLRQRYQEAMEKLVREDSSLGAAQIAVKAAAELGYSLPEEGDAPAAGGIAALGDDALEDVAGGVTNAALGGFNLNRWIGILLRKVLELDSARFGDPGSHPERKAFASGSKK